MRLLLTILFTLFLAAPAQAFVNGIADDNLPLLTNTGRAALLQTNVKHARLVVTIGTSPVDPQVKAWMHEANAFKFTITIAPRRIVRDQPVVPSIRTYSAWLRSFIAAYPRIQAIEALNEPDVTHISVSQAAAFYRAAIRIAAGRRLVLAGSFTDNPNRAYFKAYAAKTKAKRYALHAYKTIQNNRLSQLRQTIRDIHATSVWITETAAFVSYDGRKFTPAQQAAQAARVVRLSNWRIVKRTYWTGFESCVGCQPSRSAPKQPVAAPAYPLPAAAPTAGPVIPYEQAPSGIDWDTYLIASTGKGSTVRQHIFDIFGRRP